MIIRALVFLLTVFILAMSVPPLRRRFVGWLRGHDWVSIRRSFITVIIIYFLISLIFTLYKYSGSA